MARDCFRCRLAAKSPDGRCIRPIVRDRRRGFRQSSKPSCLERSVLVEIGARGMGAVERDRVAVEVIIDGNG
jgi:hypothetical protein